MVDILTSRWRINDVEAVLFDKDGTIIDSHKYWGGIIEKRSKALREELKLNFSYHKKLSLWMGFSLEKRRLLPEGPVGIDTREEVIRKLTIQLKNEGIEITQKKIGYIFNYVHTQFVKEIQNHLKILPGVKRLLEALKEKKVKMAIITTDSIKNTEEIISLLNLKKYFDVLIGREYSLSPKASGIPARIALDLLKTSRGNTISIGDAPMDLIMAKKAGLKAGMGVALGQIPYADLLKYTRFAIHRFKELKIIQKN